MAAATVAAPPRSTSTPTAKVDPSSRTVTPAGQMQPVMYDQVPGLEMCAPMAFYVDAGKVILCPEACAALQNDKDVEIEVEFTCEPLVPN